VKSKIKIRKVFYNLHRH